MLPTSHRTQKACENCKHCLHLPDGHYCNRNSDRAEYPDWQDEDGLGSEYRTKFEAAIAWDLAHEVNCSDTCDEHIPALEAPHGT